MRKINNRLFKKSFDLKKIVGGRVDVTYRDCSTETAGGNGCGDVRNTTTSDNGTLLSDKTINHPCPA